MKVSAAEDSPVREKPRGRGRKPPHERSREIVGTALACFMKKGLKQTTMQDIARECGISVGHVYNFFDGKESVVEAVIGLWLEDFIKKSVIPIEDNLDYEGCIRAVQQDMRKELPRRLRRDSVMLMLDLYAESLRNERINACLQKAGKRARIHIIEQLSKGYERRNQPVPQDIEARVSMMFAMLDGMVLQHAFNPALRLDDMMTVMAKMLIHLRDLPVSSA